MEIRLATEAMNVEDFASTICIARLYATHKIRQTIDAGGRYTMPNCCSLTSKGAVNAGCVDQ